MGEFRIGFGKASCQSYKGSNQQLREVCAAVFDKISYLKTLKYTQLSNWKDSEIDIRNIEGKEVSLTSYVEKNKKNDLLVVVQVFYPTLIFPNYLSFSSLVRCSWRALLYLSPEMSKRPPMRTFGVLNKNVGHGASQDS